MDKWITLPMVIGEGSPLFGKCACLAQGAQHANFDFSIILWFLRGG
jgi:hypothetical protein